MEDLEGGNFSISNPGIFGSMFGTPLINYPQAAVFNMNAIKEDVVAIDGKPEIRPVSATLMSDAGRLELANLVTDDVHRTDVRPSLDRRARGCRIPQLREGLC